MKSLATALSAILLLVLFTGCGQTRATLGVTSDALVQGLEQTAPGTMTLDSGLLPVYDYASGRELHCNPQPVQRQENAEGNQYHSHHNAANRQNA